MENNQPLIQYTTVSDSVYLWIKNAIIEGKFKPGEHIPQETLTKKLGVSRTPIRDAMKRLETEGLLVTKPHCGAVVFRLTEENLKELYEIRIMLEQYCAARACEKASDQQILQIEALSEAMKENFDSLKTFMQLDRQFHSLLCTLSGCTNTVEILEGLWNKCDSFKSIYFSLDGRTRDTLAEHTRIIHSLKCRDSNGIKDAISTHLRDVVNTLSSKVSLW